MTGLDPLGEDPFEILAAAGRLAEAMAGTTPAPVTRPAKAQKAKRGLVGAERIPRRQSNGYYADDLTGARLRSVTTILNGGMPKTNLLYWYAFQATDCAISALPELVAASRSPARLAELRTWIGRAPDRKRDERGDVGTAVHKIVEAHILGTPVPEDVLADPEMVPYLAHFLAFIEDWQVTFTASEMVVANPECGYAGTLDYTLLSPLIVASLRQAGYEIDDDVDLMGDTKTGGTLDALTSSGHVHGVYPEAGLQMSAYRRATECWLRNGERVPMPVTAEVGIVLHLRPEGYRIFPARCGDEQFRYFQHAQVVDEWTSKVASAKADRPVIGEALRPPTPLRKVS